MSAPITPDDDEADLWFLPGPPGFDPETPPGLDREEPGEADVLAEWQRAEAGQAARLAHVAGRLGALDDRLTRGPEGWRHRLALIEAAELSWFAGDRISAPRLALWVALRLSGVQEDAAALARVGWAVRRLGGGPGPEAGLPAFLGRHDTAPDAADPFAERAGSWEALMALGASLHPITRACMGFHLWALAGLDGQGGVTEAAVTAARSAAGAGQGALFVPLVMGGAAALRAGGAPASRLKCWLEGVEGALLTAMRHLDQLEAWDSRARAVMSPLSGRTPGLLRAALADWPLVSAPMAERLTGASRAAVQRNLAWMEERGLIREVTGQGRFRMWCAVL